MNNTMVNVGGNWTSTPVGWVQPVTSSGNMGAYTVQVGVAPMPPVAVSEPEPGQVEETIDQLLALRRRLHAA
jgi:hypothetical protein